VRAERTARRTLALAAAAFVAGAPATASAATVEIAGPLLTVTLPEGPRAAGVPQANSAYVNALPDGGVIVSIHGGLRAEDRTFGPGCQQVSGSTVAGMPAHNPPFPRGAGDATFAVTCNTAGARVIEGRLLGRDNGQGWLSTLNLPTNVTAEPTSGVVKPGDVIVTGAGGDRIDAGNGPDTIDAGGAPFKGQAAFPPTGDTRIDDPQRNFVNGGDGDDTLLQGADSTGRDTFSGGGGTDTVTYADRVGIGTPGQEGVHVSLDDQQNDGDPNLDPPDSLVNGETDNIKSDVENVIGTRREDFLVGNASRNLLNGGEAKDILAGGMGIDRVISREPPSSGVGTRDEISCGSPNFPPPNSGPGGQINPVVVGVIAGPAGDTLEADLADVPPRDCEMRTEMAVAEPGAVSVAASARLGRGGRLPVKLTCPRAAKRTCKGTLQMAGERPGSRAAKFSIAGGRSRVVNLRLSAAVAAALSRPGRSARVVASEKGLKGAVTTTALLRVRR
jgi:hypothetical protein